MNRSRYRVPSWRANLALMLFALRFVCSGAIPIPGSGLAPATAMKFGAVKATAFTVKSHTQATAAAPAGVVAGAVAISSVTPGGTAASPTKFKVN